MGRGKCSYSDRFSWERNGQIRAELRCHMPPLVVRAVRGRCILYNTASALSNTGRSYSHRW
jgi:hypothetical protein